MPHNKELLELLGGESSSVEDELRDILSPKKDRYAPTKKVEVEEEDPGVFQSALIGVGKGMTDIGTGIKSRLLRAGEKVGLVEKNTVNDYLKQLKEEQSTYSKSAAKRLHPISSVVGEAIGESAALPIPPIFRAGQAGGSILGAAARTAGNFGAAGAAYGMADAENADKGLLQSAAQGIPAAAMGGALGGTFKTLAKGAQGLMPQGSQMLNSMLKPQNTPEQQALLSSVAKETGLKPTFGEIAQSPTGLSMEGFMSGIPFNKMRSHKFEAAAAMEPSIGKFTDIMAGKWANVPESSFIKQLGSLEQKVKSKTDELYTAAASVAKKENLKPNPQPIRDYIKDQINLYETLPGKDAKRLIGELNDQLGHIKNLTYDKVDFNVKYLSKLAYKKYKQSLNGTALPDEYQIYYKLRDSYLDALDNPNASISVKTALNTARDFYKNEVTPFQDPKLQQFMNQEIAFDKFLKSMTDNAKAGAKLPFFEKLGPDEQQLLRKDFLGFIRNEATQADGALNVPKFLTKLNQYSSLKPQIFGEETKKFEAYAKLLGVMTPEKDLSTFKTMVGGTLGSAGAAVGAVANPILAGVVAPVATTLWAYSRMATSERGQRILSNMIKINNKTDQNIVGKISLQGEQYLKNLFKNIPSIYTKNITTNVVREQE